MFRIFLSGSWLTHTVFLAAEGKMIEGWFEIHLRGISLWGNRKIAKGKCSKKSERLKMCALVGFFYFISFLLIQHPYFCFPSNEALFYSHLPWTHFVMNHIEELSHFYLFLGSYRRMQRHVIWIRGHHSVVNLFQKFTRSPFKKNPASKWWKRFLREPLGHFCLDGCIEIDLLKCSVLWSYNYS